MDRVVIALGGNALLRRGEEDSYENMFASARGAAEKIADIASAGWEVVVTHGNGPQVGRILLQQEAARGCRAVPSPDPYSIVEASLIRELVADGVVVIAAGGGGVPVVDAGPRLVPTEGVVDKDLAAAILAHEVEAPTLLVLTDVRHVQRGFGTDHPEPIDRMTTAEARALLEAGAFGAGSMGPKIEAAVRFIEAGGRRAVIGDLDEAAAVLERTTGTTIVGA